MEYHNPVLLKESIEGMALKSDGIYVDVTFGGGGHSKLILEKMGESGKLFGFDQDADAEKNALTDERFQFVAANFEYIDRFLKLYGVRQVDAILADLGVSSFQINEASRGFSYRFDADLDMRMNQGDGKTAADVVNNYSVSELIRIFSDYGQVRNSKTLAHNIVQQRVKKEIKTINEFIYLIEPFIKGERVKYLSVVFQALRMEVNDEVGVLKRFLEASLKVLKPGGRLVVITYHSVEDRVVKRFLKNGNFSGEHVKDKFGNIERPFTMINKRVILPSKEEIRTNKRARSAKLRIAEKKK